MLVKNAFGNFRQLLDDVTLHPAMGYYLNTKGNQKENTAIGRTPDENYPREGLLPSTSVDRYAATLARWFGVSDAELAGILPNPRNFGAAAGRPDYPANLGFMA